MDQGNLIIEVLRSHSVIHTTLGKTPLDAESARRRHFHLTTHNTQKKHPYPPVGFEPVIPASERWQTHALDRAATGIDFVSYMNYMYCGTWLSGSNCRLQKRRVQPGLTHTIHRWPWQPLSTLLHAATSDFFCVIEHEEMFLYS
jgi:hypothetical protein